MEENNIYLPDKISNQKTEHEDLLIAYQTLPQMIACESEKQWSSTSVFIQFAATLVVGSFVPSFIEKTNPVLTGSIGLILSLIGILASVLWLAFFMRYQTITHFWIVSMREIEENLSSKVHAFQNGKVFAKGKPVTISGETIYYKRLARFRAAYGFYVIYISFMVIFLSILILNILRIAGRVIL